MNTDELIFFISLGALGFLLSLVLIYLCGG